MTEPTLSLLSRLWLREPDEETLSAARGLPAFAGVSADFADLAPAYIELFVLNVYPYGTVFTEPSGELNGRSAWEAAGRFEEAGYRPPELSEVGAPDHAGLCLGFLGHLAARGGSDGGFAAELARWLPVCALAAEREPSAHPFYRALARVTREELLSALARTIVPSPFPTFETGGLAESGEEVHLSDVIRFLLAPSRSGLFLSRSRLGGLGREAGLDLPFGSRFDVARTLFLAAGEAGRVPRLLELLAEETAGWESAYRSLAREHPAWRPQAEPWLARLEEMRRGLRQMREILDSPLELEYDESEAAPPPPGPD